MTADVLARLVDVLYPPSAWGPGARELDAHRDILAHVAGAPGTVDDHYCAAPFVADPAPEAGWQIPSSPYDALVDGLQTLDRSAHQRHGHRFADLDDTQAATLVREAEPRFVDLVLSLLFAQLFVAPVEGAYELDAAWAILDPRRASAVIS